LTESDIKALEIENYAHSPSLFIAECVLTRDEADEGKTKPFPDKAYLKLIDERFLTCPILAIPKSRRMIVTWRLLALHLWWGLFKPNQHIFFQSKKAADSAYLLGDERLLFLYGHLPTRHHWPQIARKIRDRDGKGYDSVQFDNGTRFDAIAEGPDQLRQYTASRVYCTEMAFWERARDTWTSLRPTIQGGGKIVIDSSANPGFFQALVEGEL
jgi:hypothetical protein